LPVLPRGFDKGTAEPDIAVRGAASTDDDFTGEGDRVRYRIETDAAGAPFAVTVALRFQPLSVRGAENLRRYDAAEPRRFVSFFDAMTESASVELARAMAPVR
jgi:hypothetical protein